MLGSISPSSSGSSSIIKSSVLHLIKYQIMSLVSTFLLCLSSVSTENPFSIKQDHTKITSALPISKTSASIANLAITGAEYVTWNDVFATKLASQTHPSPSLTFIFHILFCIAKFHARCFSTTEILAPVSTIASTSCPAKCNFPFKRRRCQEVCPMADKLLLICFPNPILDHALLSCGVTCQTSSSSGLVSCLRWQGTEVSLLSRVRCNLTPGGCFSYTSYIFLQPFLYPLLLQEQSHSSSSRYLTLLFSTILSILSQASSANLFSSYLVSSSGTRHWQSPCVVVSTSTCLGQSGSLCNVLWPGADEGWYCSR